MEKQDNIKRLVRCPICFGEGKIRQYYLYEFNGAYTKELCHGCLGKGYLIEEE